MKQNSVENRIIEVANNPIDSKLNLVQFKREREKAMRHKAICEAIVSFSKENIYMPMYAILSVGVGANAVKNDIFNKGYRKFDSEKAQRVFDMAVIFTKGIGKKVNAPNDVAYRICNKYYSEVSESIEDFKAAMEKAGKKLNRNSDSRDMFYDTCKVLGIRS